MMHDAHHDVYIFCNESVSYLWAPHKMIIDSKKIGWKLLDTYFKTNDHFITQHHLDSYNNFVTERIPMIVRSLNPITVLKPHPENKDVIKHRIDVFVGGEEGDKLYFDKPTIIDPKTHEQKLLFPNEARLFNYDYVSDIYADITVRYTLNDKNEKLESVEENFIPRVKIGTIPIMLHCQLCTLHNQPFNVRREMGECPYDQGGYFIINGKEKVCVAQERNITNALFVTSSRNDDYSFEAFIRCTSEASSIFPKTIRFYVHDKHIEDPKADTLSSQMRKITTMRRHNAISVEVPHITTKIPLFILYRLLGVESDKNIIDSICMFEDNETIRAQIQDFIRPSAIDANFAFSQDTAAAYLKSYVSLKTLDNLYFVIQRNLFPNLDTTDHLQKVNYLSYNIYQLIRVCLGLAPETDRDNYMYKRIGISGFLLGDIFKDYYNAFRVAARNYIDRGYEFKDWKMRDSLAGYINNTNKNDIFRESIITGGMIKSIKGSWGMDNAQGIVQDLNRISFVGFLSHLRRVNTPMDSSIKLRRPHQLNTSQYGMVCPSESPDGGSIGLLKNFSITCFISFDVHTSAIRSALEPFNVIYLPSLTPAHLKDATKLCINNTWVGVVHDTRVADLVRWIKLLRRNSLINNFVSVSWNIFQRRVNILTDNGRCTRPLFLVDEKTGKLSIEVKANGKKSEHSVRSYDTWHDYIRGDTLSKEEYDFYFAGYKNPFEMPLGKGKNIQEIMNVLDANSAVVEFLDVEETNTSYIAMYPRDLPNEKTYTHCEIHPSTMFSIYTVGVPFANHNAPTRIVFSGAQGKQAIGVYATNFNNRIDTMGYVLHYPQKPLVKTRFNDYMNATQLPNGENLIVAICSYTGYNQEDSVILNKRAIEKGMFNVSYYKCYSATESGGPNGVNANGMMGNGERVIFANKKILAAMGESFQVKPGRYDKLDDNGLPIVGSYIQENDAYLGKFNVEEITEVVDAYGNEVKRKKYVDRSDIADKTVAGIVDKVVMFQNGNGDKEVKIRMRKIRTPELGDKVASRMGQKGVCGLIMPHEDMPFSKDGIIPDIIINPHAFPSRMTIGHLIESLVAKTCAMEGFEYDAVPYEQHDTDTLYERLERNHGLHKHGDEILYNGRTGDQISTEIFFGPTYYQRLKHMVADKINYRTTGRVMGLTKQPTKGRSNEGGLRIGEMEANAIISHGMSAFIKEAFFERSDKYEFYMNRGENTLGGKNRFNRRIMAPYTYKLLTQELQTMAIDPKMITDTDFHDLEELERMDQGDYLPDIEDEDDDGVYGE